MPRHRPPREVWLALRRQVWLRDGGYCQGPYCQGKPPLPLNRCQIDHIQSGKGAGNALSNLRVLCRSCHALRTDPRHRGLIGAALKARLIPSDWRRFVWDNDDWPSEMTIQNLLAWEATTPDQAGK
ncbi:MAG: HNH endonuclease [Anaerolineae bacterium]|nr:HNH endonuclease [Anaerolineae bacterium]